MQHQQAERRSLLHVGARDIKLEGGRGDGRHKDPRENLCPYGRIVGDWPRLRDAGSVIPGS